MNILFYTTIMFLSLFNKKIFNFNLKFKTYSNKVSNNFSQLIQKSIKYDYKDNIENKKLISISPGGLKGFYLLGTISYIKENYDLSNYIFSGASAGSWCSLIMSMNKKFDFFNFIDSTIINATSILEIQLNIKRKLLYTYKDSDFDLTRVYIGVTTLQKFNLEKNIYTNFADLEDAIDCCIASSHIPFVTGGCMNRYHNMLTFDGGFSNYPYIKKIEPVIHIHPNIWNNNTKKNKKVFFYDTGLSLREKYNFNTLFMDGYNDAKKNKDYLTQLFHIKI